MEECDLVVERGELKAVEKPGLVGRTFSWIVEQWLFGEPSPLHLLMGIDRDDLGEWRYSPCQDRIRNIAEPLIEGLAEKAPLTQGDHLKLKRLRWNLHYMANVANEQLASQQVEFIGWTDLFSSIQVLFAPVKRITAPHPRLLLESPPKQEEESGPPAPPPLPPLKMEREEKLGVKKKTVSFSDPLTVLLQPAAPSSIERGEGEVREEKLEPPSPPLAPPLPTEWKVSRTLLENQERFFLFVAHATELKKVVVEDRGESLVFTEHSLQKIRDLVARLGGQAHCIRVKSWSQFIQTHSVEPCAVLPEF